MKHNMLCSPSPPNSQPSQEHNFSWLSREETINFAPSTYDIILCLTLYNEPENYLRNTLSSIAANINTSQSTSNTLVCIIADGLEAISESTLSMLESASIFSKKTFDSHQHHGIHITRSSISTDLLINDNISDSPNQVKEVSNSQLMDILFCVKPKNAGKLDSHWWFYTKICPFYTPKYCFQIDTGTTLKDNAIEEMCKVLDTHTHFSAAASSVIIKPEKNMGLLHAFQCGDFAVQKSLQWPCEIIFGYLSVLPGQFSGASWKALSKKQNIDTPSPIDRYLRGMHCEDATENIMFLAEDRILGFELLAHKGSNNRLCYASESICHTDKCDNINELLKQRRRWMNSSFMCRSWMLNNIYRYIKDSKNPTHTKFLTSLSALNLGSLQLLEWFLPTINILLLAITYKSLASITPETSIVSSLLPYVFSLIALTWVTPSILALTGQFRHCSNQVVQILLRCVYVDFFLIIGINALAIYQGKNASEHAIFLLVPFYLAVGAILGAIILHKQFIKPVRQSIFQYIAIGPAIHLMLCCYAFYNMHDNSWGTKGLSKRTGDNSQANPTLSNSLSSLRASFITNWLVSNCVVLVALFLGNHLTLATQFVGGLQLIFITIGVAGTVIIKYSTRHQHTGNSQVVTELL